MKKFIVLMLGVLIAFGASGISTKANNSSELENVKAVLINEETGEERKVDVKVNSFKHRSFENELDVTYSAVADLSEIMPMTRDSSLNGQERYDCEARVTITYDLNASQSKIKVKKMEGSWTPKNKYILVSNRAVGLTVDTKSWRGSPSSNNYTEDLNWDWANRLPQSSVTGARAWHDATVSVAGMGGSARFEFAFNF